MSKIKWVTAVSFAGQIESEEGKGCILIQTDRECVKVAQVFGWSLTEAQKPYPTRMYPSGAIMMRECRHRHTDGSIDCPTCDVTVSEFVTAARLWLEEHDGATVEDPGYFE